MARVSIVNADGPAEGAHFLAWTAAGELWARSVTDSTGQAALEVPDHGTVVVERASGLFWAWADVTADDHLSFGTPPEREELSTWSVSVLPPPPGATALSIHVGGCARYSVQPVAGEVLVSLWNDCVRGDFVSVVVAAWADTGLVATAMAPDLPVGGNPAAAPGPWTTDVVVFQSVFANVDSGAGLSSYLSPIVHGTEMLGSSKGRDATPLAVEHILPSPVAAAAEAWTESATITLPTTLARSHRTARASAAPPETLTTDVATEMLPFPESVHLFLDDASGRPSVAWASLSGGPPTDGTWVSFGCPAVGGTWVLVAPPETVQWTIPLLPEDLAPVMAPEELPACSPPFLTVFGTDFLGGYDAFRSWATHQTIPEGDFLLLSADLGWSPV